MADLGSRRGRRSSHAPTCTQGFFLILNLGMLLTIIVYQSYASLFLFNIKLSIHVCSVADWGSRRGYRSSYTPACTHGFFFNLELMNVTDNNCVSIICIIISVQYQLSIHVCSVADWGSRRGHRSSHAPACTQGLFFNFELLECCKKYWSINHM